MMRRLLLAAGLCLWGGQALAQVQHLATLQAQPIWPGVVMQAAKPGARLSVARFTIAPGAKDPASRMRHSEEWFLIERGHGTLWLDGKSQPVGPGDLVAIGPAVVRQIGAAAGEALVFEAITSPAFEMSDYVEVGR